MPLLAVLYLHPEFVLVELGHAGWRLHRSHFPAIVVLGQNSEIGNFSGSFFWFHMAGRFCRLPWAKFALAVARAVVPMKPGEGNAVLLVAMCFQPRTSGCDERARG